MEPQLPIVTVVIPNHNYGHWIKDAVDSVILQDYPAKRIVIVDDNSKDSSVKTIRELYTGETIAVNENTISGHIDKTPLTTCILRQDGNKGFGPSLARNVGIKLAFHNTHIFMFLDADDYWLQGKISKSVAKIIESPDKIGVVYTDNYGLNVNTGAMIREYRPAFDYKRLLRQCYVHSGSAVTRLAFTQCGLYDPEMRTAEDWDLWIRISKKFLIYRIPEPLVVARNGEYNSTNSVPQEVWRQNWQRIGETIQQTYG